MLYCNGCSNQLGLPVTSLAPLYRHIVTRPVNRATCPVPDCSNPDCGLPQCGFHTMQARSFMGVSAKGRAQTRVYKSLRGFGGVADDFGPAILMGGLVVVGALVYAMFPKEKPGHLRGARRRS